MSPEIEKYLLLVIVGVIGWCAGWYLRPRKTCDCTSADLAVLRSKLSDQTSRESDAARKARGRIAELEAELKELSELVDEMKQAESVNILEQEKGFHVFRASDARVRAMKKVGPAKSYNVIAKAVNKAIDNGAFEGWTNPPSKMSMLKK